jgi:hypothetical protein
MKLQLHVTHFTSNLIKKDTNALFTEKIYLLHKQYTYFKKKGEATVKSLGAMKQQHRGRHLAAGRRGEPKELT